MINKSNGGIYNHYSNGEGYEDRVEIEKGCFDFFSEAIFILCEDKIVMANDKTVKLTGLKDSSEVIGKPASSIKTKPTDFLEILRKILSKFEQGKCVQPVEQKLQRHDGVLLDVKIAAIPHIYKGKNATMVIFNDLTEKRELEARLKAAEKSATESQMRFERVVELSPNAVITHKGSKIVYANKASADFVGIVDHHAMVGRDGFEFMKVHHEDRERILNVMAEIQLFQVTQPFIEHRLIKQDGTVIDAEVTATSYIENGELNVTLIARDITERKEMDKKLRISEGWHKKLIEFLPEALFITQHGIFVSMNKAAVELLGKSDKSELIGRNINEFTFSEEAQITKNNYDKLYNHKKGTPFVEQRLMKADGSVIDIEVGSLPFEYEGREAIITSARDVTERKKAEENRRKLEQALENDRMKTEFFSNLSHELKTPLNIILASIQLMDSIRNENGGVIDVSRHDKYTSMMKQNCFRLLRLINNLIDITRLDVGFLKMNFAKYNIVEVVEDICMSVVEYVKSKELNIIFDTDNEEIITTFDADKIERVILNLLSNAIKFTEPGGEIFVSIHSMKDSFFISVKDTGVGIPRDMLEKVFDRFKQVDQLFTRNREGSGIGLSLVKSIVEAHGGTITVESEIGTGSEFIIELPVRISEVDENLDPKQELSKQNKVERISIEFSDIYS